MNEIEEAARYIEGVIQNLEGYSDTKRIEILTDNVKFWYMSAITWRNAYETASKEIKEIR